MSPSLRPAASSFREPPLFDNQCYGDAGFSLRTGGAPADHRAPVDPRELTDWARSIAQRATLGDDAAAAELQAELDDRLAKSRPQWLSDAALCAAVGAAYAELGAFDKALEYHRRFMKAEQAEGSVHALEQLANIRGRLAVHKITSQSSQTLREAEQILKSLIAISPTSERYSLLGGIYKRQALVAATTNRRSKRARHAALGRSLKAYATAVSLARETAHVDLWLPFTNMWRC